MIFKKKQKKKVAAWLDDKEMHGTSMVWYIECQTQAGYWLNIVEVQ